MKRFLFFALVITEFLLNGCRVKESTPFDSFYSGDDEIWYHLLSDTTVEVMRIDTIQPFRYEDEVIIPEFNISIINKKDTFGYKVVGIGDSAFYDCTKLTSVVMPATIRYVKKHAFANCTALTTLVCKSLNPSTIDQTAFEGCDVSKITLYVFLASVEAYRQDPTWGQLNVKAYSLEDM